MANWHLNIEEYDYDKTWAVFAIDKEHLHISIPYSDIDTHDVQSFKCHCEPITSLDGDFMMITHNSFLERKKVDEAMNKLN